MRIGLVCSAFLPATGGVEWQVHHVATEYVRLGHDVTVFASRPRLTLAPIALPVTPTYEVVRCGLPLPLIDRSGAMERIYRRAILARYRRRPYDVLHCHSLAGPTRFGLAVKRRTGVPVVATTVGADVMLHPESKHGDRLRPWVDRIVRANARDADVIGAVNSAIRAELEQIGTLARIVDIPNGVDWDRFQQGNDRLLRDRLGLESDAVILISVGRRRPVKGYEVGLRAFARVAEAVPRAVYVLVGQGIPELGALVHELQLEGRVRLLDRMPGAEIPSAFRSADVFFSPSFMEGFSQVNVQAMASGLPCVISDGPGNVDAATGGGAVAVHAGDEESMARGLGSLLRDADARRRLGAEAHERSRRFAWSRIAEDYLGVFADLLSTAPPEAAVRRRR